MRARPEPTQLEHLSDVTFLGKLLVFPPNVRLDWKVIASYKHSSLFGHSVSDEDKSFITLTPGVIFTTLHFLRNLQKGPISWGVPLH